MKLWKRDIAITVDTYKITGLRMAFKVARDLSAKPNTAEVQFWNLNQKTRGAFSKPGVPVLIQAGYEASIGQLFLGEMRTCQHRREGVDIITKLTTGDGDTKIKGTLINTSMSKGTKKEDVFDKLATALGITDSTVKNKLKGASLRGGQTTFEKGMALLGNAWDLLVNMGRDAGLEISVQDGLVQVLDVGTANTDKAVDLGVAFGLIGSPEYGENGRVKCKSLLQPGLYPGRKVMIESQFIFGSNYRVESVTHVGDTHGQEWYSEVEAMPI